SFSVIAIYFTGETINFYEQYEEQTVDSIEDCRRTCGGHGYSSF
ncbi:13650_t:CDS:2, partial [Gigaspora rosea]